MSGKTTAKKEAKKDMNEKKHAAMTSATNAKQENQATHQMKQDAVKTANTAKKP